MFTISPQKYETAVLIFGNKYVKWDWLEKDEAGAVCLSMENFYLSLKYSSELYQTREGCSSLFWVKAQETCESFLLNSFRKYAVNFIS